ncbi:hypothetical protein F511_33483 [Dorcoceras hygrometricum]|uniref:Uncharacterized protein n=1 Tax=Dorcoceras hygrometricum TaxID=472368 RepID=A0A2Z7BP62_9LAMI|nr:hypothetical protein F511_33483 [Dorcoceras hygrometricum]
MSPEDSVMTSRILPKYVFPYVHQNPTWIRLSLFVRQDRREYLVRDTRCRLIFARICSPPPPNPSINTSRELSPDRVVRRSLLGWLVRLSERAGMCCDGLPVTRYCQVWSLGPYTSGHLQPQKRIRGRRKCFRRSISDV